MARATIVRPEPVPATVKLTLDLREAEVLRALLFRAVTGTGPGRKTLDGIETALSRSGVNVADTGFSTTAFITG